MLYLGIKKYVSSSNNVLDSGTLIFYATFLAMKPVTKDHESTEYQSITSRFCLTLSIFFAVGRAAIVLLGLNNQTRYVC